MPPAVRSASSRRRLPIVVAALAFLLLLSTAPAAEKEKSESSPKPALLEPILIADSEATVWKFPCPFQDARFCGLSACSKTRPVRAPGLQKTRVVTEFWRPRALTRRFAGVFKHALKAALRLHSYGRQLITNY